MKDSALVLWIPQIIYSDSRISSTAKLILAEIFNLLKANNQCWASNGHFSELFGIPKKDASYHLQKLIKTGWIFSKPVKECEQKDCNLKNKGWHRHIIAGEPLSKILDSLSKKTVDPIQNLGIPYPNARHDKSNIESNNENKEKVEKIKKEIRERYKKKIF